MNTSSIRWLWSSVSAVALALGAVIAINQFPEARFGVSPTGVFGWHLVYFSFAVGAPLAIAQLLVLSRIFRPQGAIMILTALLWIPVTCGAVIAMLLPMWWWSAADFASAPVVAPMPLLPGVIMLGLCQGLLLQVLAGSRSYWLVSTILGAIFGSIVGLILALDLREFPLEVVWALFSGLGIGLFQSPALVDIVLRRRKAGLPQNRSTFRRWR